MASVHEEPGWRGYRMEIGRPHEELEPAEREEEVVGRALAALVSAGILPAADYDGEKFLAFRRAVRESFEIPWTAITPRMQRLLYAVNAAKRPAVMVAVGIFCGYTLVSNAGAAFGPGACYRAERLVGVEIRPEEAERARRNVLALDPRGGVEIVADDGKKWLSEFGGRIDLLYLDADKSAYLPLVRSAMHALGPGSLVLAHNSINLADALGEYLAFVRGGENFRESVNVVIDDQGLEVSLR